MQSISKTCARLAALILTTLAACAPADTGSSGGPPPDPPDAGVRDGQSCAPGQPPCPSGTECVDFGDFGGQVCAANCQQSAECGGDRVCVPDRSGKGVCASAAWGGPAGIYPELLCRDENVCNTQWDDNENGCNAYLSACLGGLTTSQLSTWTTEVGDCLGANNTCSPLFTCLQAVPWC